eukprot:TCALIF_12682-PA protein Name:"Similar to Cyp303a1 Probable cytochrome P450 303a1 (Drosophila melanogaster)" AED:0.09 eAED:0.09 QI:108/0.85/0.87/1/0.85/0.75/8/29/490
MLWLFLLTLGVVIICIRHLLESWNFPPGPPRYPIIGSLLSIEKYGSHLILQATKLIPQFPKMVGFFAGQMRVVIINDFDLAKKMAFSDTFSGRLIGMYTETMRGYNRNIGVISTQGQIWRHNRRFSLTTLKEFGFGNKGMWSIIADEAGIIVTDLKTQWDGQDLMVNQTFNISVLNILFKIVSGKRYRPDDPEMKELMRVLALVFKSAYIEEVFPILQYTKFTRELYGHSQKQLLTQTFKSMFEQVIQEHEQKLHTKESPEDFIDVYLQAKEGNDLFTKEDLIGICMDFFEAGGETVGSTLSWVFLYMSLNPEVQEKCRKEILQSLGWCKSCVREPTMDYRGSVPYTEATIMEIQRCSSVAPSGLEHKALEDTELDGYTIKKDTLLFYNINAFFMDRDYWGDPEEFRPERFLNDDGSKTLKIERFIPFGFGKRVCMGESLAKAELFIFTIMILQNLRIKISANHAKPDPGQYEAGITRSPLPFHVTLEAI